MQNLSAAILSVGVSVPDEIVTNADLMKTLDTSDDWIVTRTGIRQRRITPKETPVEAFVLGARAGASALSRASVKPADVDAIVCATFTPDYFFPSTACKIQHELGCANAFAFDISAACAGFVYGISIANSLITSGQCRTVLLVGTEIISKTLDWTDRSTSILFGDGAGAVVIQGCQEPGRGVLASSLRSNGSMGGILYLAAWGPDRTMKMKGNEVFRHAIRLMSEESLKVCRRAGLSIDQIDLLIPHQANIRIIDGLAEHLGVPKAKVVSNIDRYGNTSSASIPLALDEAWSAGRVKRDTVVLFTALGGGITTGSAVVRF
jgi:3-oxoacyl-[acyl-carrier-protein] synthase III